jgi:SAM-dependent methyltransferase
VTRAIRYIHRVETHNTRAAAEILPFVFDLLAPKKVLDIGCANGSWLEVCKNLGSLEVLGVDGIEPKDNHLEPKEFLLHDFRDPLVLSGKFDLVLCLEVAEHLPVESANALVEVLVSHGDVILFSAAVPGQGGQYHLNEQWPEYWNAKFKAKGFTALDVLRDRFWNNERIFWWYRQNMMLYVRSGVLESLASPVSDSVRSLVHPDLYRKKVFHPKYATSRQELLQLIWTSVKYLVKSFIKKEKAE